MSKQPPIFHIEKDNSKLYSVKLSNLQKNISLLSSLNNIPNAHPRSSCSLFQTNSGVNYSDNSVFGLLEISSGILHLQMPQGQWDIPVSGTVNGGANPKFALGLRVGSGVDTVSVGGLVTTKGEGRIELKSDKLDLAPYAALAKHYAGVEELKGDLSKLALIYVNEKGKQRYSGEVNLARQ